MFFLFFICLFRLDKKIVVKILDIESFCGIFCLECILCLFGLFIVGVFIVLVIKVIILLFCRCVCRWLINLLCLIDG